MVQSVGTQLANLSPSQIHHMSKVLTKYLRLSHTKKIGGYLRLLSNVSVVPTQWLKTDWQDVWRLWQVWENGVIVAWVEYTFFSYDSTSIPGNFGRSVGRSVSRSVGPL